LPGRLLLAFELLGSRARPDIDDPFDCWGLLQRVFDWLDDGFAPAEGMFCVGDRR